MKKALPPVDRETLTKVVDAWYSTLSDEILKMWQAAPVGNHKPELAKFAAQQAHDTLKKAIASL